MRFEIATGGEGLAGFDDLYQGGRLLVGVDVGVGQVAYVKVSCVDFAVLGKVEVFFCDQYTL